MRESSIEKYLNEQVEKNGGLCEKHVSPGQHGVPDDLVTWPGGTMELVECKATGETPDKHQLRDHARRAKLGVKVFVIDSKDGVDHYVRRGNP